MKRIVSMTTAAEFCDALENWIIDNKCNPTTPEEWNRCIEDLMKSGALTPIAAVDEEDACEFKKKLKDNLNIEEL